MHSCSLLRSRSGRSHVTLPVPTRLLQPDVHSFLGNKRINVWLSFSCECSCLWLVQRLQWQLNERLIGPCKQKRKTPRKECMSVWSSRVGTGSVTWLRLRLRRRLALMQPWFTVYFFDIWTSMLWSIDTCQNKISADQHHVTISRAQVYSSSRSSVFLKLTADRVLVFFFWLNRGLISG